MPTDGELLRSYAGDGSESAFTEFVQRHLNMVYRTALRRVGGDAHAAADVTQRVFTKVARKARTLEDHPNLAGWLYTGTRFAAAHWVRTERRRRTHEQEATAMNIHESTPTAAGGRLEQFLDEVTDLLPPEDRDAIVLHYLEGRTFAEIGSVLSLNADAARMRVHRALDRLRRGLARRGVTSSAEALGAELSSQIALSATAPVAAVIARHALSQAAVKMSVIAKAAHLLRAHPFVVSATVAILAIGTAVTVQRTEHAAPSGDRPVPVQQAEPEPAPQGPATTNARASPALAPAATPSASDAASSLDEASDTAPASAFGSMSPDEKNVLKALWTEEETRGPTPRGMRWSLNVHPDEPKYPSFQAGRASLLDMGFLGLGVKRGFIYLSPSGRKFCRKHAAEIDVYPAYFGSGK